MIRIVLDSYDAENTEIDLIGGFMNISFSTYIILAGAVIYFIYLNEQVKREMRENRKLNTRKRNNKKGNTKKNNRNSTHKKGNLNNGLMYRLVIDYIEIYDSSYKSVFNYKGDERSVSTSYTRLVVPYKINGVVVKKLILDDIIYPRLKEISFERAVQVEFNKNTFKSIKRVILSNSVVKLYSTDNESVAKVRINLKNKIVQYLSLGGFYYYETTSGVIITSHKDKLESIDFPNEINGKTVIGIDKNSFRSKGIMELVLPPNLEFIGEKAFMNNSIYELNIPNSVVSIGEQAFKNNKICYLNLSTSLRSVGHRVFSNNSLTSISIPDNIIHIRTGAFETNALRHVELSNRIKSIGPEAFMKNFITRVSLPVSLKKLNYTSFANNPSHIEIYGKWLTAKDGMNFHTFSGI